MLVYVVELGSMVFQVLGLFAFVSRVSASSFCCKLAGDDAAVISVVLVPRKWEQNFLSYRAFRARVS